MSAPRTRFGDATLQGLLAAPVPGGTGDGRGVTFVTSSTEERRIAYGELAALAAVRLARWRAARARAGDRVVLLLEDRAAFVECLHAAFLGGLVPVPVAGGISDEHRAKLFAIARTLGRPWLAADAATLGRLEAFASARGLGAAFAELAARALPVAADDPEPDPSVDVASEEAPVVPGDVALIQFSSGSTGSPKGVVLTHANVLANVDAILDGMAMAPDDVMSSWMPLTHDMGLIGFHLVPRLAGIDHTLVPTELFVRRPAVWLDRASAHRATVLCSPNFGYEHCLKGRGHERAAALDLSAVRLVFNGAEPISAVLAMRFLDAFAPAGLAREAMFPVYGLAEASLAVTFPPVGAPMDVRTVARDSLGIGQPVRRVADGTADGTTLVGLGRPIRHVEVRVADVRGGELPTGHVGRILMRGPNVTAGYLVGGDALDTSDIDADGWLDTGDLGVFLAADGGASVAGHGAGASVDPGDEPVGSEGNGPVLFVTGRAKDIVFAGGRNLYPADLERLLVERGVGEAGKVVVAAAPTSDAGRDLLVAFVQHRGDGDEFGEVPPAARAALAAAAGVRLDLVVPVARVPKTTSGKVQRYRLVESLLAGDFEVGMAGAGESLAAALAAPGAFAPPEGITGEEGGAERGADDVGSVAPAGAAAPTGLEATQSHLLAICRARVEGGAVGPHDNLFELGISSLVLASIHADIDATWPGALDITDLFDHPSVREIATVLAAREAGAGC